MIVAATLVVLAIAGGVLWQLTWSVPEWWAPPSPDDDEVEAYADRVEYRMVEEAQRIRDTREIWKLRVREEQINAWLATRLPKWVAHQHDIDWPEQLGRIQLNLGADQSSLAIEYFERDRPRVLVVHGRMFYDGGALCIAVEQIDLGRLPLPGRTVARALNRLEEIAPELLRSEDVNQIVEIIEDGACMDPGLTLADGRRVQLLDVQSEDGSVVLTCRTAARPSPHAADR